MSNWRNKINIFLNISKFFSFYQYFEKNALNWILFSYKPVVVDNGIFIFLKNDNNNNKDWDNILFFNTKIKNLSNQIKFNC